MHGVGNATGQQPPSQPECSEEWDRGNERTNTYVCVDAPVFFSEKLCLFWCVITDRVNSTRVRLMYFTARVSSMTTSAAGTPPTPGA